MSALAILLSRDHQVSGSDPSIAPALQQQLNRIGVHVWLQHDPEHLSSAELVILSSAIPEDNAELQAALTKQIPLRHRVDVLVELCQGKRLLAVAGTHGKGTTTGMLGHIFRQTDQDPSLFNGAELVQYGQRAWWGQGCHFIAEMDESDGSFLKCTPTRALITNIDADHLNFWGDMSGLLHGFGLFAARAEEGLVVHDSVVPNLRSQSKRLMSYGRSPECSFRLLHTQFTGAGTAIRVVAPDGMREFTIPLLGEHNAQNAIGALALSRWEGVPLDAVIQALTTYRGIRRRLERKGESQGVLVFDDHADHPTEIARSLGALQSFGRPIFCVLQPHRYSRVQALLRQYATALEPASTIVLLPVFSAGEPKPPDWKEGILCQVIREMIPQRAVHFSTRAELPTLLQNRLRKGDLLLFLGPGDISEIAEQAWQHLSSGI
jgi:UDP-N-acetylmuramate--alanine ligase